ncbi:MAG: hypothetical protein ABH867_04610 [Patescibacteria group bacterium]
MINQLSPALNQYFPEAILTFFHPSNAQPHEDHRTPATSASTPSNQDFQWDSRYPLAPPFEVSPLFLHSFSLTSFRKKTKTFFEPLMFVFSHASTDKRGQ